MQRVEERFMRAALALAARGLGRTRPNPAVGAVIVKRGAIIGRGYHAKCGLPHAEAVALARAKESPRGADLYVTLEPCGHHGRTPPCADAIIAAGIARVFYGCPDPNPITAGKGLAKLRRAGVVVVRGPLADEARRFNEPYLRWVAEGRPLVTAKWAMTLDGKIATRTRDARWISSEASRRIAHALRNTVDAVMIGTGTALADDPALTCRLPGGRTPLRVLLDRRGRVPLAARLFAAPEEGPVLVYTADARRARALAARGIEAALIAPAHGELPLKKVLRDLGARGVHHLLLEGGAALLGSFFDARLVDRLVVFVAPKIAGGAGAPPPVAGLGVKKMDDAAALRVRRIARAGPDIVWWADVERT
jgi:diaminohydroxyphosphoribosylaminopyrimidine deaminase / 5-amino-6-(5-phosphoribosylamino)uracil reductase